MRKWVPIAKRTGFLWLLCIAGLIFSFWLMFHTFTYDSHSREFHMATTVWSDFGSQIPLVRSFSKGDNLTRLVTGKSVEHPLFPGEPIRYHFLFYMTVGILERIGMPIDWAMNIPSALGFILLLVMIYIVSYQLFGKRAVSLLSVIFFLFNGSLSFLSYFQKAGGFTLSAISHIPTTLHFPSFGPWDGGLVSAFWSLNIYTNQRHLALSYGLCLVIIYLMNRSHGEKSEHHTHAGIWQRGIILGLLTGVLLFLNQAVCAIAVLFAVFHFLTSTSSRLLLGIAAIVTIPFVLFFAHIVQIPSNISFYPGYLTPAPLTLISFVTFWFYNLGIHMFLIPLSIFLVPKKTRLILIPLAILFIIPNLIQLSPDMINNHKFFNFFFIMGSMYGAYAFVRIAHIRRIGVFVGLVGFVILTFSGIIDLFVIINDTKGSLPDTGNNPTATFISRATEPGDVILNSTWFYHPASLAGRSIFAGYPYFTWSYGYDKEKREALQVAMYEAPTKVVACRLLLENNIAYVELGDHPETFISPNRQLFENEFTSLFSNTNDGTNIYDVRASCLNE